MPVPEWVKNAIFYQIFPDRFANGDPSNDPSNVRPWGSTPTQHGFQGGDLAGITQKLDYLVDLGINAVYLNPIFQSASTHRYDTTDYFRIDPRLGTLQDFQNLIRSAHNQGIRVILDGVFNHTGRGFFAFSDLLENGPESPYLDWYHVRKFPLRAYESGHARNYLAWWGIKSLPKLNTQTPAVRNYLLDVARYWIDQGADGWRLDVPNEIDDDSFWAEFHQVVRTANPQAYLLGEIWEVNDRWTNETHFDGLMNYPLRTAILEYLNGKIQTGTFAYQIESLLEHYPRENRLAMYLLLGSHDTERALTYLNGNLDRLRLAFLFQFAYPGIPAIYYGDEIGLQGGKDPDCRGAFPWDRSQWNLPLQAWVKQLIEIRKSTAALREGDYLPLLSQDTPAGYAFARHLGSGCVIVALNASEQPVRLSIPVQKLGLENGTIFNHLLTAQQATVENGTVQIELNAFSGAYLGYPI